MNQLSWKIYAGTGYSRVNRIQVFEKPDTGGTMDDGDKKSDFADAAITEIEQGFPDVFKVKKSIFVAGIAAFDPDPGHFFDLVILLQVFLVQDLVNGFASVAAKGQVVQKHRVCSAIFTAMYARLGHSLKGD
jgi:hypothetical protein